MFEIGRNMAATNLPCVLVIIGGLGSGNKWNWRIFHRILPDPIAAKWGNFKSFKRAV